MATAAAALLLGLTSTSWAGAAAAEDPIEANLQVVGTSDLGRPGVLGDVTVVGTTAVVAVDGAPAPGSSCPASSAKVVDVKDPARPRVVATIALPPDTVATDVEAASLATAAFTGDLLAVALSPRACAGAPGASVVLYDITDPAHPAFRARTAQCGACGAAPYSVSLAERADGRALLARVNTSAPGVAVDDVTDPSRPVPLGQWSAAPGSPAGGAGCAGGRGATTARLTDDGFTAVAVAPDGKVHEVHLGDPAAPTGSEGAPAEPANTRATTEVAVMVLGNRTLAIVSEDGSNDPCVDSAPARGLRVLALQRGAAPNEMEPVRFPRPASPGRLATSGSLAYVAWHGDGVRVIDFGQVRPRTVAQFAPAGADVVGVGLLPDHVVVTDAGLGLYVLERPTEGGAQAGFWSKFLGVLPYLAFAVLASAAALAMRLLPAAAMAGAGAGVLSPEGARRRRA